MEQVSFWSFFNNKKLVQQAVFIGVEPDSLHQVLCYNLSYIPSSSYTSLGVRYNCRICWLLRPNDNRTQLLDWILILCCSCIIKLQHIWALSLWTNHFSLEPALANSANFATYNIYSNAYMSKTNSTLYQFIPWNCHLNHSLYGKIISSHFDLYKTKEQACFFFFQ